MFIARTSASQRGHSHAAAGGAQHRSCIHIKRSPCYCFSCAGSSPFPSDTVLPLRVLLVFIFCVYSPRCPIFLLLQTWQAPFSLLMLSTCLMLPSCHTIRQWPSQCCTYYICISSSDITSTSHLLFHHVSLAPTFIYIPIPPLPRLDQHEGNLKNVNSSNIRWAG